MNHIDAQLKRYYRQISAILPCKKPMRKDILSQLQGSVAQYRAQNPDADFPAIRSHFGTPEQIAAGYIDDQDADALIHKLRIKRRVLTAIVAALTAIVIFWGAAVTWVAITESMKQTYYIEVDVGED